MNKSFIKTMVVITLLLSTVMSYAQIKNAKTETVKVYGNCGMCEATIEKAGSLKKVAKVDWNQDTKMATLTYDAKKTTQDEILKKISLAGYDSDKFLAPDDAYNNLHGCCQYERDVKVSVNEGTKIEVTTNDANQSETPVTEVQKENQLKSVFDNYFNVKDALIKSDGSTTAIASKELVAAINAVKMDKLEMDVHMVWMKVVNQINEDAAHIAETKDVKHQREHFMTLSNDIYALIKVSKNKTTVYYQFCPMANDGKGANWLSKEKAVRNPYYGSMMLSCGKTVETIN